MTDWPTFVMASSYLRHYDLEPTGRCAHCNQPVNPGLVCSSACTIALARTLCPEMPESLRDKAA